MSGAARGALALSGLLAVALGRAAECPSAVGYRVLTIGDRPVALWYPTAAQPARLPYSARFSGLLLEHGDPALARFEHK